MYYVCETLKMLENVVKGSEFGYTREQRYTKKVIYYYYYYFYREPDMSKLTFPILNSLLKNKIKISIYCHR